VVLATQLSGHRLSAIKNSRATEPHSLLRSWQVLLSDDHRLIRSTVRDFALGEVAPVAAELDKTKSFPYEIVRKLGELNLSRRPPRAGARARR
jgi:alkylation response protein AidB-like acyl-CoA dehydrogenase